LSPCHPPLLYLLLIHPPPPRLHPLSLHDALPISPAQNAGPSPRTMIASTASLLTASFAARAHALAISASRELSASGRLRVIVPTRPSTLKRTELMDESSHGLGDLLRRFRGRCHQELRRVEARLGERARDGGAHLGGRARGDEGDRRAAEPATGHPRPDR